MRSALIIANTEYVDPGLAQLTAPGKDAEDFARVLKDKEICAFDEVNTLLNQPEYVVRGTIDEFFDQKKPDDLLVLYFSGHGVRDELGALYLAVKNTIRTRLRSTAIKSDYIREAMDQSRSKRQVLILDCCNSGAFAQGTKAATGVSIGTASAFEAGYGRIILTASDSTQFAWEGDKVIGETDNSLFTHFLVQGLEGEADLDGDGNITVDELYDYAYEKVKLATPKQTPSKFSTKQQGEIILRQFTRLEDIKAVSLSDQLISEIENPYPEVRLRAIGQLAKLVAGKNLGLARSAREALERLGKEDDSHRVVLAAKQALASAGPVANLAAPSVEGESSQSAQKKVEEAPITRPGIKAKPTANTGGEQVRNEGERIKAIQAARDREKLERQLKLQQKSAAPAVQTKTVQEQRPKQQSIGRSGFMISGVGLIVLACVFGLVYASSHWPFPTPQPTSSPPTTAEPAPTLTPQSTDTAITPPTTVSTTEAPPTTPAKTNTPPQLSLQGNISREGDTTGGAVISYQVSATDAEDGPLSVACAPRSGSLFSVGSTSVNCSATDSQGATTSDSFTVEVKDTTPPIIVPHADVSIQATSASGAIVTYTNPTTSDIVDGSGTARCSPLSGSLFVLGNTPVDCTGNDSHGNNASPTRFMVQVVAPPCQTKTFTYTLPGSLSFTPRNNTKGDAEFDGHGPQVTISVNLRPSYFSLTKFVFNLEVSMTAVETEPDQTTITDSWVQENAFIVNFDSGYEFDNYISRYMDALHYRDYDVNADTKLPDNPDGLGPVDHFVVIGDSSGDDLGKTKVTIYFKPLKFKIKQAENCK